jgi:hypothetical protein
MSMTRNVCGPFILPILVYLAIPNGVGYEKNFKSIGDKQSPCFEPFSVGRVAEYQSLFTGGPF